MAFTTDELNVIRSYIAYTGVAPTQAELEAAFDQENIFDFAEALIAGNTQTNTEFVTALYQNLLGREPDAGGLEFWTGLMSASQGLLALSKDQVLLAFQQEATKAANDGAVVTGKVEAAEQAGLTTDDGSFGSTGPVTPTDDEYLDRTFDATPGDSDVKGWEDDADIGNVGTDIGDDLDSLPTSKSHKIYNVGYNAMAEGKGFISANYTFDLSNQLGEFGDYEAYFLSPVLTNTTTTVGNSLVVELIDRHAATDAEALEFVAIQSFSFKIDGVTYVIESADLLNASSYDEVLAAVQAGLTDLGINDKVEASLGSQFQREQTDPDTQATTGALLNGTQIVIEAKGSQVLDRGGFQTGEKAGADRNIDLAARQDVTDTSVTSSLVATNLELDNIGFGSQGGSINISGQSASLKGVQEFNIDADGTAVWLTELSSEPLRGRTLDKLEVINLTGGADNFHIGKEQVGGAVGYSAFTGAGDEAGIEDVREFNAGSFNGNIRIDADVTHDVIARDFNLTDNQNNPSTDNSDFMYTFGGGDDLLYLDFAQEVVAYEDATLTVSTGAGEDTVVVTLVDSDPVLNANWYADHQRQDNVSIDTGAGDDTVRTPGQGDMNISTGAGDDTVYTDNSGSVNYILTDTNGNGDVEGTDTADDAAKAHWVFGASADDVTDLAGNALAPAFLYEGKLTVTFSGAQTAGGGVAAAAAAQNTVGWESIEVDIPTADNYAVDQRHINQAIKEAINTDPVLSKLLLAKDGADNTLVIESLIDGEFAADDLVYNVTSTTIDGSTAAGVITAYQNFAGDSTAVFGAAQAANAATVAAQDGTNPDLASDGAGTDIVGAASGLQSNNVINLGQGADDVLVLGTEANSNDEIVMTGYGLGTNHIVNFDDSAGTGIDQLNLTAYLTTQTSASGSSTSAVAVATTGVDAIVAGAANTAAANSVTEITGFDSTAVAGETWDAMTAANVLNAFQDNTNAYGNLDDDFDAAAALANILGNDRKHIVAIENDNNAGEYKFFELTSADDTQEFTAAQLIGTVDFGANVDFASNDILVG